MKKSFTAGLIIASMLGQTFAMAYDSTAFQRLSPEAQQAKSMIRERISNMSEKSKLKLSYTLYKVTFKALPVLEEMSDIVFNQKVQSATQSPEMIFDHQTIAQHARVFLEQIGYNQDNNGAKKPLSRVQFNERAFQYGANQAGKQIRSIANDNLDAFLQTLLGIAIACAVVGIIVWLGWMGVSILLGGLILTAFIAIVIGCARIG